MAMLLAGHVPAPWTIVALCSAVIAAVCAGALWMRHRKPGLDAMEARRRDHLFEVGRIIDGTVVDIRHESSHDQPEEPSAGRHLVSYRYRVAGVQYESAQDVTALPAQMALATSTIGFPVSVRYDPANPANSIVVCEKWLGLHHNPIEGRRQAAPAAHSRGEGLRSTT